MNGATNACCEFDDVTTAVNPERLFHRFAWDTESSTSGSIEPFVQGREEEPTSIATRNFWSFIGSSELWLTHLHTEPLTSQKDVSSHIAYSASDQRFIDFLKGFLNVLIKPIRPRNLSYSWTERLSSLRKWRGCQERGEVSRLSEYSLSISERLSIYADVRQSLSLNPIPTVLAPLPDGGVHVEWNLRENVVHHLEVAFPCKPSLSFHTLRTIETPTGQVLRAYENSKATLVDIVGALEQLIQKSSRLQQH